MARKKRVRESDFVRRVVEHMNDKLPAAKVMKHADRVSRGIPDLSITWGGRTTWAEAKRLEEGTRSEFRKAIEPLQLAECRHLEAQGRCLYLVSLLDGGQERMAIMRPHQVARLREADGFSFDLLREHSKFEGPRAEGLRFLQSML